MGQLSTDAVLAGVWPELDDVAQFGTRLVLEAYGQADTLRDRGGRRYREAVACLERELRAASRDANILGNPRPLALLTRAQLGDGSPQW
ncbi:hypothetical protein [Streptomyces finlayi]|nr:hypothetical protein [Streptomyces finlayi]